MAPTIYPAGELDQPEALLTYLGSFWSEQYSGRFLLQDILEGQALLHRQTQANLRHLQDSLSRETLPLGQRHRWYQIKLRRSECNSAAISALRYGENVTYAGIPSEITQDWLEFNPEDWFELTEDDWNELVLSGGGSPAVSNIKYYGQLLDRHTYSFPCPLALTAAPLLLTDRIFSPSITLVAGLDYEYDAANGQLVFYTQPFDDSRISSELVYTGSEVTDTEITLWMFQPVEDRDLPWYHLGYQLGLRQATSENYRRFLQAYWNGLTNGGSEYVIRQLLSAVVDVPIAETDGEVVEDVVTDSRNLLVITSDNVYKLHIDDTATVAIGDVLYRGQTLGEAFQAIDLNRGNVPDSLFAVTLGKEYLAPGYLDGITFRNADVPLTVTDVEGIAKVSFEVGGWPLDIAKFWDEVHSRGLAAGQTLADLLDTRTIKEDPPRAGNLPATVNPLEFLAANVLRRHALVIQAKTAYLGPNRLDYALLRMLRHILPSFSSLLLVFRLSGVGDTITPAGNILESASTYYAAEPTGETVVTERIVEQPRLRYIDCYCP